MLFGDEPRGLGNSSSSRSVKINGLVSQTDTHVGPGSYFLEDASKSSVRRKSFSTRQPMSPGSKETDRQFVLSAGVLTSLGVAHPGCKTKHNTPGPGYYMHNLTSPEFSPRPKGRPTPVGAGVQNGSPNKYMGSSPRITKSNSILKDGILFEGGASHTKNSPYGPGYYFVEQDNLNKKSFNARIKNGTGGKSALRLSSAGGSLSPRRSSPKNLSPNGGYSPTNSRLVSDPSIYSPKPRVNDAAYLKASVNIPEPVLHKSPEKAEKSVFLFNNAPNLVSTTMTIEELSSK